MGTVYRGLLLAALPFCLTILAHAQSGYQTINGTRVLTEIDQSRGVATFSNDCGSQTLTQSQLQNGALPTNIIPCPRPSAPSFNNSGASVPPPRPVVRGPSAASPIAPKPKKMAVNEAQCQEFSRHAATCAARLKTAASGQATSFRECIDLYCKQQVKAGCRVSNACAYGPSAGQRPVKCGVGQHLFFPGGYGSTPICQDNAPSAPTRPRPGNSDITGTK